MHDSNIQRAPALEAAVREHLEHLAVLAEHISLEFRDSVRISDQSQMLEQDGADAASLEPVENCKRDFRASRIGAADITADADKALAPALIQCRGQPDVILEIEIGQPLQIVRRQVAPDSHESKIDGLFAEAPEMIMQALLIVGTNRADSNRAAVEHRSLDAVIPRVDQYVAIFHIGYRVYRVPNPIVALSAAALVLSEKFFP